MDRIEAEAIMNLTSSFAHGFAAGFMISREGFNGEVTDSHSAPDDVVPAYGEIAEFMEDIDTMKAFTDLQLLAAQAFADTLMHRK